MRVNDAISGGVLIAVATILVVLSQALPPFPGQRYGPSLFPTILGVALAVCGVSLVLRGLKARGAGAPWVEAGFLKVPRERGNVLVVLGAILAYILLADRLGFVPTAFAILLGLLLWLRVKPPAALLLAVIAVLAVDAFFGWLFRVPLPLGILPNSPSSAFSNWLRGI